MKRAEKLVSTHFVIDQGGPRSASQRWAPLMASITKTTTMNGGTRYRVRWRVDGRTVERWTPTLAAARALKTQAESDALTGIPLDPQSGARLLNDYFTDWVASRLVRGRALSPTTRIGYERLWRRTVEAGLGRNQLRALRPESIRSWHADVTIRAGSDQAAKAYRLVRAVLATAEADEFIRINPCRIRGGGQEHHQERPMVDTSLVLRLAETIEPRYRALVLVAGFAGLRTGESLGLRRCDVDLLHGELRVIAHAQDSPVTVGSCSSPRARQVGASSRFRRSSLRRSIRISPLSPSSMRRRGSSRAHPAHLCDGPPSRRRGGGQWRRQAAPQVFGPTICDTTRPRSQRGCLA